MQFFFHVWHPPCYSCDKPGDKSVLRKGQGMIAGTTRVVLEELVNIYKPARSLRSESNTTFVTSIVRTKSYGERRFDKAAASLWNDLPNELRNVQSVNVFKKKLKTHFFRQAFLSFYLKS